MKKFLLALVAICSVCLCTFAQKQTRYGTAKGSVLYDNGYGYRADVGTTVYVIKQSSVKGDLEQKCDSILKGYYSLYKYADLKGTFGSDGAISKLKEYGFWVEPSEIVTKEGEFLLILFDLLDTPAIKKEITVGASGEYSVRLPYGNYYFIFHSGNKRVSDSLLSSKGLYQVYKVKINRPTVDLTCKFKADYY